MAKRESRPHGLSWSALAERLDSVGLDVSDRYSQVFAVDDEGEWPEDESVVKTLDDRLIIGLP